MANQKIDEQQVQGYVPTLVSNGDGTYHVENVPCGTVKKTFANKEGKRKLIKTAALNIPKKK